MAQQTPTESAETPLDPSLARDGMTTDGDARTETEPTPLLDGAGVVGIDGSSGSLHALRWTAKRADLFGHRSTLCRFGAKQSRSAENTSVSKRPLLG